MKKMTFARTALAGAILMGMGAAASAAVVTLEGDTLWFSFDDAQLDDLFGGYSVTGDTLSFDPTVFRAKSNSGVDVVSATTPQISVAAKEGFFLTGASLHEQGDYFRIGAAGEVAVGGQFILNNSPTSISAGPLTATTTIAAFTTTPWEIDSSGSLSGAEGSIKLQNILLAGSIEDGNFSAFIEKKLIEISVDTQAVPLPPAAWMLGSALVGLVTVGRRKLGV